MPWPALTVSFWEKLEKWDHWLFSKVNSEWTNGLFDLILPYLRDSVLWVPLYLFVLVFMMVNFGKKGLWWCVAFIIAVSAADLIGTRIFKYGFERTRPCNELGMQVRLLIRNCPGGYSFVSNHAANHFALATFAAITIGGLARKWMYLFYLWAAAIAYAQVYVGVHFPSDILGGALLGTITAYLSTRAFRRKMGTFNMDNLAG
jgi:membrane-associated phospholipid phosphatase